MKNKKMHEWKVSMAVTLLLLSLSISTQAAEFHLTNGDRLTGEPVDYDGEMYHVKSEYGVLSIAAEKMATIGFNPEGTLTIREGTEPGLDNILGKIEHFQNGAWKMTTAYGYAIVNDLTQIRQINTAQAAAQKAAPSQTRTVSAEGVALAEFYLTNSDKMTGEPVEYDGQTYRVKSEYGILSIPAERVLTIFFNPDGGTVVITEGSESGEATISGKIEYLRNGEWKISTAYGYIIVKDAAQIKQMFMQQEGTVQMPMARSTLFRSQPGEFSVEEIKAMVQEKNFRDSSWNKAGDFPNVYEAQTLNGDKVVFDRASGLIWQQSGSPKTMRWQEASGYIDRLNRDRCAGYADWRLPTIEELASLLEPTKKHGDFYIDPVFDTAQKWCWSADKKGSGAAWLVDFSSGSVNCGGLGSGHVLCSWSAFETMILVI